MTMSSRRLVSVVLVVALFSVVAVPSPPAEANGAVDAALGLAAFAAIAVVLNAFTPKQTQAAVVVYPPPQPVVSGPATYPSPQPPPSAPPTTGTAPAPAQTVYPAAIQGGLTVGNSAGSPIDVFVNGQLVRAGMPHGEVTTFGIPGSGTVLARLPEGKFTQKNFWAGQREAIIFSQHDFPQQ